MKQMLITQVPSSVRFHGSTLSRNFLVLDADLGICHELEHLHLNATIGWRMRILSTWVSLLFWAVRFRIPR